VLALFLQLVVSGIATGMLYALVALSMTVGYRATTVVNFGHGDMVMAGAYAVFVFAGSGLPFVPALLLAIGVLFLFGFATQRGLMQPIIAAPHLSLAMMALAIGYAVRGAARLEWGSEVTQLTRPYAQDAYMVGPVVFTMDDVVIGGFVLTLLGMRAVSGQLHLNARPAPAHDVYAAAQMRDLRFALELYERERGHYPERLEALVSEDWVHAQQVEIPGYRLEYTPVDGGNDYRLDLAPR